MVPIRGLTAAETEALLVLFKDVATRYNANSLSNVLDITRRGALKVLKHLAERDLVVGEELGRATFYTVNLSDAYAAKTVETLLIQEAREHAERWIAEFEALYPYTDVVIVFGSIVRDPADAEDVDLLIVTSEENMSAAENYVAEKNTVMTRPVHPVYQSPHDLEKNLADEQPVIVNALKHGYVLHGGETLVEAVKHVAGT